MELVLKKQESNLARTGGTSIGSYGGGSAAGGGGGMGGNLAQDLIDSLKDLTSGVRKLITAVQFNTKAVLGGPSATVGGPAATSGGGIEKSLENDRARDEQTALLAKIEINTRGMGDKRVEKKQPEDDSWGIGKWGLAIAGALGVVAGLFMAQVKTMKFFGKILMEAAEGIGKVFNKVMKFLKLDGIQAQIGEKFKNMVTFVEDIITSIKGRITKIGTTVADFFTDSVTKFKKYFSFFEDSKIGQILKGIGEFIGSTVKRFVDPFIDAFSAISETGPVMKFVTKIREFFGGIASYFSKFAGVFKVISKLVAKIAYPITIIMGLYDTIVGAVEGYEKEGILGAIQGGIVGLINGVFMSFFDLIKDGISWLLGAIGFDDAEKWLDSFSFQDLYASMMDKVFHPIRTIQEAFEALNLDELIFQPMAEAWGWLTDTLGEIPGKIGSSIDEYIVTPLKDVFSPVVDFFKEIKDKVVGFFTGFEIPGISIKIPFKDDPFKIGPWYPFKGDTSSNGGDASTPAPQGNSSSSVITPSGSSKVEGVTPKQADNVYSASKANADTAAQNSGQGGGNTTIVNAPVSSQSKTTNVMKPNIRNQESSVGSWMRTKFV